MHCFLRRRPFVAWIRAGLFLLFFFVSVIPHRYIWTYESGWYGWVVNHLAWLPASFAVIVFFMALLICGYQRIGKFPLSFMLFFWVGFNILGGMGSIYPMLSISREVYYFLTGGVFGGLAFIGIRSEQDANRFLIGMFCVAVFVALYGIVEFVIGQNYFWDSTFVMSNSRYAHFAHEATEFGLRIRSSVGHPVYLGGYLVLCLPLCGILIYQPNRIARICGWCGGFIIFCALVFTFTRGAWLGAVVSGILYSRQLARRHIVLASVLLLVLGGGLFSLERIQDALVSRGTLQQISQFKEDPRSRAYLQSTNMVLAQPFWGIGTGHYRYLAPKFDDYDDTPDNMYLRLLSENGIISFGLFIFMLGLIFRRLLEGERWQTAQGQGNGVGARSIYCGFVGFCVDMITFDALFFPLTRITFWILVGVGLALWDIRSRGQTHESLEYR